LRRIYGPPNFKQIEVSLAKDAQFRIRMPETARRVGKTPVWIFHGDADDSVPVEESRKMCARLKQPGPTSDTRSIPA